MTTTQTKPLTRAEKYLLLGKIFECRVWKKVFATPQVYIREDDIYDFFNLDNTSGNQEIELLPADAITLMDRMDVEHEMIEGNWHISIEWLLQYFDII